MGADFDAIHAALWAKVSTASGFTTKTRRMKHYGDVEVSSQPALFQLERKITIKRTKGQPAQCEIEAVIYIYAYSADVSVSLSQLLYPLVKNVLEVLDTAGDSRQTLGRADVQHCWVEGDIELTQVDLGDQCIAAIPVRILAVA